MLPRGRAPRQRRRIPARFGFGGARVVDLAATAVARLGVSAAGLGDVPPAVSDGDPFDALRPQLRTCSDETAVPAATGGFPHTPPAGRSVDNSRTGSGGATWWAGWTFTADESWSRSPSGQLREPNVRSRGAPHRTFDSTSAPQVARQTAAVREPSATARTTGTSPAGPPTCSSRTTAPPRRRQDPPRRRRRLERGGRPPDAARRLDVQVRFRWAGDNRWYRAVGGVALR
ncbi:hypothetical protein SUDANB120_02322 [Streptomyces sp. enrichment culture]|uniref:hypothetical protein n=1 Tax=Streptomyces sp. enrichment culture TaxID=1795815 RepID=UPI003F570C28